jgi:PAS domain S-box-containing protein
MERNLAMIDEIERMARIGCWELDLITGRVSWSDEVYRIFGITPNEFSHTEEGYFQLVHPEDRDLLSMAFTVAREKKQDSVIVDYRIKRHDTGEVRYIHEVCEYTYDTEARIIAYHGILQDVTDRTRLEMELRHSEAHFRQLANNLPAMICEFLPDGTLTYVNKAYCEFYEMTEEELVGRCFLDLLPEHQRQKARNNYLSLTPEQPTTQHISSFIRRGELRWREWRDLAFFDENGVMIKVQGLGIDITDRKRAEIALHETNKKLQEAREKAEDAVLSKSRFLDSMSHEIRTPLNGIVGMMQVMELTKLSDEQKELLDIAQISSNILLNLINNILDYSKIKSGINMLEKVPFDLAEILDEVGTFFAPMSEMKGVSLYLHTDSNVPERLQGDPIRLKQILINLVGNAFKFTDKGRIDVSVRVVEQQDKHIKLEWIVKDTGSGIPESDLDTIFLSFTQAESSMNRQQTGTGLGLAICATIVEQMQGEIWVESEVEKGSRFYFTCMLELTEPANGTEHEMTEIEAVDESREFNLLVVDDDEASRLFIDKIGDKKGWHVTKAANGLEAIDAFQSQHFDIILMDIQMPETDGTEVAHQLRQMETGSHTPMIAVTAKALPGDREKCLEAGLDDYLAKPFTTRQLVDLIETWTHATH